MVSGASPEKVVLKGAAGLLPDFIDAAKDLVRLGAEAITTNCGFLSLFQKEIAAAVGVPVATSSLMQVPWVQATLPPGKRVGLVTVSGSTLTPAHLEGAGVPLDTPLVGTEHGKEFFRVLIKAEKDDMDVAQAERDVVEAGKELVAKNPDVGAIVLECTNMPPYAAALQAEVGLAGLRHLFHDHLVSCWTAPARVRLSPAVASSSQPLLLFALQSLPQPRYIGLCAGMNAVDDEQRGTGFR